MDIDLYLSTPHVLLSLDGSLESGLDKALADRGQERDVQAAVTHFPTIPHILNSSAMLANVPGTAAAWFARHHDLEVHAPPLDFPTFEVALLSHVRVTNDPAIDWFRDLVAKEVRDLVLPSVD